MESVCVFFWQSPTRRPPSISILWAVLLWLEWFFSITDYWKYPLVMARYCDYPNVYGYGTKGYAFFLFVYSMFLTTLTMQLQCTISVQGKCAFTKACYVTTASVNSKIIFNIPNKSQTRFSALYGKNNRQKLVFWSYLTSHHFCPECKIFCLHLTEDMF